jgi:hypothetical protein
MQDRQNMLIAACAAAVIGAILAVMGRDTGPASPEDQFEKVIASCDLDVMTRMLDAGEIDPNGRGPGGMACWLRVAMNRGALVQSELLLKKGADPLKVDGFGTSPLAYIQKHEAELGGSAKEMKALFEHPPTRDVRAIAEAQPSSVVPTGVPNVAHQLAELCRLKEQGHLTQDEFERAKGRVLAT